MNTPSVLEKNYQEAKRPYSQRELTSKRFVNKRRLRLGNVRAEHVKCGHFYLTKYNGRKAKEILESKNHDTGNCSVCWKLSKTPQPIVNRARELVNFYQHHFQSEPTYLTYELVECEIDFYKWLYEEFV